MTRYRRTETLFIALFIILLASPTLRNENSTCAALCDCSDLATELKISCAIILVIPAFPATTVIIWLYEMKLKILSKIQISLDVTLTRLERHFFYNLRTVTHIQISLDVRLTWLERHFFYNLRTVTHIEIQNTISLTFINPKTFDSLQNLHYLGLFNNSLLSFPDFNEIHAVKMDFILWLYDMKLKILSKIDISETAVTSLPNSGLESLWELKAQNVWFLKKLPPQSIDLTYTGHCCGRDPYGHTGVPGLSLIATCVMGAQDKNVERKTCETRFKYSRVKWQCG